jgi:hypothetical protein
LGHRDFAGYQAHDVTDDKPRRDSETGNPGKPAVTRPVGQRANREKDEKAEKGSGEKSDRHLRDKGLAGIENPHEGGESGAQQNAGAHGNRKFTDHGFSDTRYPHHKEDEPDKDLKRDQRLDPFRTFRVSGQVCNVQRNAGRDPARDRGIAERSVQQIEKIVDHHHKHRYFEGNAQNAGHGGRDTKGYAA